MIENWQSDWVAAGMVIITKGHKPWAALIAAEFGSFRANDAKMTNLIFLDRKVVLPMWQRKLLYYSPNAQ